MEGVEQSRGRMISTRAVAHFCVAIVSLAGKYLLLSMLLVKREREKPPSLTHTSHLDLDQGRELCRPDCDQSSP